MKKCHYALLLLSFLGSCSTKNHIPADIIKPVEMQNILWDMLKADIFAQEIVKKDSNKKVGIESDVLDKKIFFIHHIDRSKFENSFLFYQKHPALLKMIFDSMSARQTRIAPKEIDKFKHLHKKPTKPYKSQSNEYGF